MSNPLLHVDPRSHTDVTQFLIASESMTDGDLLSGVVCASIVIKPFIAAQLCNLLSTYKNTVFSKMVRPVA